MTRKALSAAVSVVRVASASVFTVFHGSRRSKYAFAASARRQISTTAWLNLRAS